MRVFVTGIRGFIGRSINSYLSNLGHDVLGCSHSGVPLSRLSKGQTKVFSYGFDQTPVDDWFRDCDSVIHCAYDPSPGSLDRNVMGTGKLLRAAIRAGVPHQIFLSSHSARDQARSDYGEHKRIIEQDFLAHGLLVIRPGMVIGNGGIFKENVKNILSAPVLVLPSPSAVPVFVLPIADLLKCISKLLMSKTVGELNLYSPPPESMLSFVELVLEATHTSRPVVPIPLSIVSGVYRIANSVISRPGPVFQRIGVMLQNVDSPNFYESDLRALIRKQAVLSVAIKEAVSGMQCLTVNAKEK
jgi:nucleoside-diphosphate-sugar epimerase